MAAPWPCSVASTRALWQSISLICRSSPPTASTECSLQRARGERREGEGECGSRPTAETRRERAGAEVLYNSRGTRLSHATPQSHV